MQWSDNLDVGVSSMNAQHQKILNLMNSMYDRYKAGEDFSSYAGLLDELKDFTIQHFKEEEEYMASINFVGLEAHQQIHKQLLEKFTEHYTEILKAKSLNDKFCGFLKLWLSAHIQGIDVKYGKELKNVA